MRRIRPKEEYERQQKKKGRILLAAMGGVIAIAGMTCYFFLSAAPAAEQATEPVVAEQKKETPKNEPPVRQKDPPKAEPEKKEEKKTEPRVPKEWNDGDEIEEIKRHFPEIEKMQVYDVVVAAEHYAVSKEVVSFLKNNKGAGLTSRKTDDMQMSLLTDIDNPERGIILYEETGGTRKHIFSVGKNGIETSATLPVLDEGTNCFLEEGKFVYYPTASGSPKACKVSSNYFLEADALLQALDKVDIEKIRVDRIKVDERSDMHVYGTDQFRVIEYSEPGEKYGFLILVRKMPDGEGNMVQFSGFFEKQRFSV